MLSAPNQQISWSTGHKESPQCPDEIIPRKSKYFGGRLILFFLDPIHTRVLFGFALHRLWPFSFCSPLGCRDWLGQSKIRTSGGRASLVLTNVSYVEYTASMAYYKSVWWFIEPRPLIYDKYLGLKRRRLKQILKMQYWYPCVCFSNTINHHVKSFATRKTLWSISPYVVLDFRCH